MIKISYLDFRKGDFNKLWELVGRIFCKASLREKVFRGASYKGHTKCAGASYPYAKKGQSAAGDQPG